MKDKTQVSKKVLDRIRKMLKLADQTRNSQTAEAMLAFEKAKKLLAQYGLDMADVTTEEDVEAWKPNPEDFVSEESWSRSGRSFTKYDFTIANAVGLATSTRALFGRHGKRRKVYFFGLKADVVVACELFKLLRATARRLAVETFGKRWSPTHRSYCEGFGMGVLSIAQKKDEENTSCQALMIVKKDTLVNQEVAKRYRSSLRTSNQQGRQDYGAKSQGYHDGRKQSLNRNSLKG